MAAARVGGEVLADYYGEAAPAGGNAGPPAQAEVGNIVSMDELCAPLSGVYDECDHDEYENYFETEEK